MVTSPRLQRPSAFATRAVVNFGTVATVGVLGVVNEVLAARLLGPTAYGLFALAVIFARVAQLVAQAGLDVTVYRRLPVLLAMEDASRARPTVLTAVSLSTLSGVALSLLLAAGAGFIADGALAKPEFDTYLRIVILAVPGLAIVEITASALRAAGGIWSPAVPLIGARALFTVGAVILTSLSLGGTWVAVVFAAATILPLLAGLALVVRLLSRSDSSLLSRKETRQLLVGAAPLCASALLHQVVLWASVVIVGWFLSAAEVGIYRACLPFVIVIEMVPVSWNAAAARVYPILSEQRDRVAVAEHYKRSNRITLFITAPYVAMLLAVPELPLWLMGPDFAAGATALMILAAGQFVKSGLGSAAFALVYTGHQRAELTALLSGAFAVVALNLILVPAAGIIGAAIATTTATLLLTSVRVALLRRHWSIGPSWRAPAVATLAVLVGGTAGRIVAGVDHGVYDRLLSAAPAIMIAAFVAIAVIFMLGFKSDERAALWRGLKALRRRKLR